MSTEGIYRATLREAAVLHRARPFRDHLDIGAGSGRLLQLASERFGTAQRACDYTDKFLQIESVKVDVTDLNRQPLPYADASFDLVTATEVVEHLARCRDVIRDIHRVLRPGGACILSTPNILNLNSRLRFLWFGFWNLFGPLPLEGRGIHTTGGHINPISAFYLGHALLESGFVSVGFSVDKYQRSAIPKLLLFWPLIKFFGALAWRAEADKYHTLDERNTPLVRAMNSLPLLLGRTVIVTAVKPSSAA
ncbi:MAG: class I SAM-dependent methyltransferase [Verrucomicrobia bacterium]|nr:MAG: class I SAM-dependent methyltransferase [Verrucomicrobiota bacterium]